MIYGIWLKDKARWLRAGDDTGDHGGVVAFVGPDALLYARACAESQIKVYGLEVEVRAIEEATRAVAGGAA